MWHRFLEWEMPLGKWHTFWMVPWLICCFTIILLHTERKWHIKGNLATILPLKSKLSGKFERFNAIDGSIQMLKNSCVPKISIKMKLKF